MDGEFWGIETFIHAAIGADYCSHSYILTPPPSPFFQVATWQEKMEVFNASVGDVGKGVKGVNGKDDKCMIM
jgi:hypothetical protein